MCCLRQVDQPVAVPRAEGVHISAHMEPTHQPQVESSVLGCDHRMVADFKERTDHWNTEVKELRGLDRMYRMLKALEMLTGVGQREWQRARE